MSIPAPGLITDPQQTLQLLCDLTDIGSYSKLSAWRTKDGVTGQAVDMGEERWSKKG